MALDYLSGIPLDRYALNDVGVKRALCQEAEFVIADRRALIGLCQIDNGVFEYPDELVADNFAFPLRISNTAQFRQKPLRSVHIFELDMKILAEHALHNF